MYFALVKLQLISGQFGEPITITDHAEK